MREGDTETMNNGETYAAINHPDLGLVWDLHPQHHEEKKQKFLVQAKQWLQHQPPEHHEVIRSFVNKILKDPNKHLRVGQDTRTGPTVPRFRHINQMVNDHPDTKLTVHSPNSLTLQVKRHSHDTNNEGLSNFHYDMTNDVVKSEDLWYNGVYGLYKDEFGNNYRVSHEAGACSIFRRKSGDLGKSEFGYDQLDEPSTKLILGRIQPLLKSLRYGSHSGISDPISDESDNDPFQGDGSSILEKGEKVHSGIMVAIPIPTDIGEKIAVKNGESPDKMHATLLYVPKVGDNEEVFYKIVAIVSEAAKTFAPLKSKIAGIGRFSASKSSDGKDVFYAGYDAPALPELRQYIFDKVKESGIDWESKFGFTPHITLKYIGTEDELPQNRLEGEEFICDKIIIKSQSFKEEETFTGDRVAKSDQLSAHFSSLLKSGDGGGKFIRRLPDQHSNRFGSEWYKKSKKDKRLEIQKPDPHDKIPLKTSIADAVASVLGPKIKKEELDKGAAQRLFPVESPKPLPTSSKYNLKVPGREKEEQWQSGMNGRDLLPVQSNNERARGLLKLTGQTNHRKNSKTGENEFLLHRAHHPSEVFGESHKSRSSSWTPRKWVAEEEAKVHQKEHPSKITSAWFPESDIKHYTFQTPGAFQSEDGKPYPEFGFEKEVVIKPGHKGIIHSQNDIVKKSEYLSKADDWKSSYEQHLSQPNKLIHYSKKAGLTSLDPTFQGTGAPSEEYKHGLPSIPRTYFYQHGTEPEDIVKQGAVAKYTATLKPEHKIYDLAHDKDNIHHKLKVASMGKQVNPGVVSSDDYLHAIKAAGYHGFKNSASTQLPNVIALFHAHPIDYEETVHEKT
jgi:2'-5' RNA ligase